MKNVPRIGRILDVVGLLLFAVGGTAAAWAWLGFRSIPDYVPGAEGPAWAAVTLADGYWRIEKVGTGLMLAGLAVFVVAWWVARAATRRDPSPQASFTS